jgi:hypothetical protein
MGSSCGFLGELRSLLSIGIVDAVLLAVESIAADSKPYVIRFNEGVKC